MTISDGNTPQEKIAKIIEMAAPALQRPTAALPHVVVYGSGSVVAAGDVHIHHHHYAQPSGRSECSRSAHDPDRS